MNLGSWMKIVEHFIKHLSSIQLAGVFNPYADRCSQFDRFNAATIRRANLRSYLEVSISTGVNTIWFGRDLGYRGGRRTGIALTDEMHLPVLASYCKSEIIKRATNGEALGERTATVIWKMVAELGELPFMWNAFPFHPHEIDNPMSNRSHSRKELEKIWSINQELLDTLQPSKLIAIGNDARDTLLREGFMCEHVRHPSYGGQAEFVSGLRKLYGVNSGAAILSKSAIDQQQLALVD